MMSAGRIVVAATPIGDPRDASAHLVELLAEADLIAAEDTRRLRRLLGALGITTRARVVSYFDANESERAAELVDAARGGSTVVVVTDAGMPTVSDPGYRIVRGAIDAGVPVAAAPGPSAVLAALAVSGLPVDRFCFEGFMPRKAGERRSRLAELAHEPRTMVFFEAPHRVRAMLEDAAGAFGADRPAAMCRELTKTYEEVVRGTLTELVARAQGEVLGEVTVVIAGATARVDSDPSVLVQRVRDLEAAGLDRKAATIEVAKSAGVPRRAVFDALVAAKVEPVEH
jgi:16S rRNA (cytidine1402-2'-O)-methyltransferase